MIINCDGDKNPRAHAKKDLCPEWNSKHYCRTIHTATAASANVVQSIHPPTTALLALSFSLSAGFVLSPSCPRYNTSSVDVGMYETRIRNVCDWPIPTGFPIPYSARHIIRLNPISNPPTLLPPHNNTSRIDDDRVLWCDAMWCWGEKHEAVDIIDPRRRRGGDEGIIAAK